MPSAYNSATPTGAIHAFGGTTAPAGWLLCDGTAVSQATYAALFAAIGTAFGNPGGGNFNVPDFRGRFVRGVMAAQGGLGDPDAAGRSASAAGGNAGNNVGSFQGTATQVHAHEVSYTNTGSAYGAGTTALTGGAALSFSSVVNGTARLTSNNIGPASNGESRSVNVYANYIIKY